MNTFVFTCGDINGIGPEIVLKTLNKISHLNKSSKYIIIFPGNVYRYAAGIIKPRFKLSVAHSLKDAFNCKTRICMVELPDYRMNIGKPTKQSGGASYKSLEYSFSLLKNNIADAVITAPVSKTAIYLTGINFPGQTEMFAHWCGVKNFVMSFLSDKFKTALYTIHIPLNNVSKLLNKKDLKDKIKVIYNMLAVDLEIMDPRIAVLGLNPHAGESGIIGNEEKEIITPVIKSLSRKIKIDGPFSSDAFFANRIFKNYDLVFGLYHDQVLIPFKYINYGGGVNYSAGLPIIRTSPDHGTAYDIAGKGIADESSMIQAYNYARLIVRNRKKHVKGKVI